MPHKRKELNIAGRNLWYLIGLITSDGSLSKDGRHIDLTFKDCDFLKSLTEKLALDNKVTVKNKGTIKQAYRIQIANRNFYDFLLSVGLTPNKSLTLKNINVPETYFVDFVRGLIDGDGCIRTWIHPSNKKEQWSLRISSGSAVFINWLRPKVELLLKAKGKIYEEAKGKYILKYGKMAAREILKRCYYGRCFGLQRKKVLAESCIDSYRGWSRSKTVV